MVKKGEWFVILIIILCISLVGAVISDDCTFETDNINLSAHFTGIGVESCWLSYTINDINYNKTASITGDNCSATILSTELIGGMNVEWNFYANDSSGTIYNSSLETFYVRKSTRLEVSPWPADGLNGWFVTEPIFSMTADSLGEGSYYQWDNSNIFLYTVPFGLENIPNPSNISAGMLELNWWTKFACGNETRQSFTFKIDLTNPLITELQPPDGSSVFDNLQPEISAYIDEIYQSNSGVDRSSITLKVDGIDVTSSAGIYLADSLDATIDYIPLDDLAFGEHSVTINATDNAGRYSEITWHFYINTTPAQNFTVYSPNEGVYGDKQVLFNITATEKIAVLEYINWNENSPRWKILCRECYEYGNSKKKTQTLKEGENNITIKAIDRFGQATEKNISLFIDSNKPQISNIKPRRNSVINGSEFFIRYAEENLQNITLFWNPNIVLENCPAGKNQNCSTSADLSAYEGKWIDYWFEISDVVRTVESRKTRVFVDTIPPILKVNMPRNQIGNETYGRNVPFNISVSEEVTLKYFDSNVNYPKWRTLCVNCNEYGNSRERTIAFSKGSHDIIIMAVDRAGNADEIERSFKVNY